MKGKKENMAAQQIKKKSQFWSKDFWRNQWRWFPPMDLSLFINGREAKPPLNQIFNPLKISPPSEIFSQQKRQKINGHHQTIKAYNPSYNDARIQRDTWCNFCGIQPINVTTGSQLCNLQFNPEDHKDPKRFVMCYFIHKRQREFKASKIPLIHFSSPISLP